MSWDGSSRDHWLNSHTNQRVKVQIVNTHIIQHVWAFVCSEREKIILFMRGKCDGDAFLSEPVENSSFQSRHKDL